MEPVDETVHYTRISRRRTNLFGEKYYTMRWLPNDGAEQIPQKSIIRSVYRKHMRIYWETLDPGVLERAQKMSIYCR